MLEVLAQAATSDADGWQTWASVASVALAFGALVVAFTNRRTAAKALRLAERQEERRSARLDLSLVESIAWRPVGGSARWIGMQVLAVNPSDRDGAIVSADLHVTYSDATGAVHIVKVPHGSSGIAMPHGIEELPVPSALPANQALAGWLLFGLDDSLIGAGAIERFDAQVRDSRDLIESVQAWAFREIDDGQAQAP